MYSPLYILQGKICGLCEAGTGKGKKRKEKKEMSYCILNFKTYNTAASIKAVQDEATRKKSYSNIDSSRTKDNEVLMGDMDYVKALKQALKSDYYTKPDKSGRLHAEPKVKGIGVVMTYSPEAHGTFSEREWIEANKAFLNELFPGCPKHFVVHRDESTVHIQGLVIPTTKTGKINKSAYIKNKAKLIEIQDRYSEAMKQFGLKRGERGARSQQEREDKHAKRVYELTQKVSRLEQENKVLAEALVSAQEALQRAESVSAAYKEAFWDQHVEGRKEAQEALKDISKGSR